MAAQATKKRRLRRPGGGRKPLPPDERRSRQVMVRFTEGDFAALEAAAGDEGVSGFIRRVVLHNLSRRR